MNLAPLILGLVFVAGYATQRGSTCAVSAAQEIVVRRRATRFFGFLICACVSLAMMALFHLAKVPTGTMAGEPQLSALTLVGGAVFGVGAYINGRCAFGTIARLGSGDLWRLGTLAGYVAGAALAIRFGLRSSPPAIPMAGSQLPALWMLTIALMAGLLFVAFAGGELRSRTQDGQGWSTLRAMLTIGTVNGVLLLIAPGWAYTSLLAALARSDFAFVSGHSAIAAILLTGAVAAAFVGKAFALRPGTLRNWAAALAGGIAMGLGASMVPGGNDRMLMFGLPMLLPNQIAAYAVMMVTLLALVTIIGRRQ